MATNIYKPGTRQGNVILYQNSHPITIKDPQGNVVDVLSNGIRGTQGTKHPINVNKYPPGSTWNVDGNSHPIPKPGSGRIEYPVYGDQPYESKEKPSPGRVTTSGGSSDGSQSSSGGGSGVGNVSNPNDPNYSTNIQTAPGGSLYSTPGLVDFSGVPTPYVDYQQSLNLARDEGAKNNELYFQNLDKAKDPALGLVQTDIQGIQSGLDTFIPQVREQTKQDQSANITNAGLIDDANLQRTPRFNEANRQEVSKNNEFNQQQRNNAVEASGLNYRQRIGDQISRLENRAKTGNLGGELDAQLSKSLANRGSDIARGSGIGSLSGAGVRANDRLTVQERVNLALGAEAQLPGVLQQGQQTLSSPEERAPTIFNQPTAIPLKQSNVSDRIPLTSNISAGAAQQGLASEVNQYQLLPATGILNSSLSTEQFNQQSATNTAFGILDRQQAQLGAIDSATQGGINADTAAGIRQQQFDAFERGNEVKQNADTTAAYGEIAGTIGTALQNWNLGGTSDPGQTGGASGSAPSGGGGSSTAAPTAVGSSSDGGTMMSDGTILNAGSSNAPVSAGGGASASSGQLSGGSGTQSVGTSNADAWDAVVSGNSSPNISNGGGVAPASGGNNSSPAQTGATVDTGNAIVRGATAISTGFTGVVDAISNLSSEDVFGPSDSSKMYTTDAQGNKVNSPKTVKMGNAEVSKEGFDSFTNSIKDFFNGESAASKNVAGPTDINGSPVVQQIPKDDGSIDYKAENGKIQNVKKDDTGTAFIDRVTKPFADAGLDLKTIGKTADAIAKWDTLSPAQQAKLSADLGTTVLTNTGMLSADDAKDINKVNDTFGVLSNPNSTNAQRVAAVTSAASSMINTQFTGSIHEPKTINGNPVIGAGKTTDGQEGFTVKAADGTTSVVSKDELANTSNTLNAINAFSVITSNASTEKKVEALGVLGVSTAGANDIVSQVDAGNFAAAYSVFNTARNWGQMNNVQRAASVAQTGSQVVGQIAANSGTQASTNVASSYFSGVSEAIGQGYTAASNYIFGEAATQTGSQVASQTAIQTAGQTAGQTTAQTAGAETLASYVGTAATGVGAVAMVATGSYQAYQNAQAHGNASSSQQGAVGASDVMAGAAIGAGVGLGLVATGAAAGSVVPIVGTAIGAAVGLVVAAVSIGTASTKGTGQMMRDGWRKGLEAGGFATKNPETKHHEVELADGTKYDIGMDGGAKLQNKGVNLDGKTERKTTDVDWSNPAAVDAIPDAHLYAMLTGLDPTGGSKLDTFHKAVALGVNAASSNAKDANGTRENFKAMIGKAGVQPVDAFNRLETLRATNKISEQEYGVYVNKANGIFGTKVTPSDRQTVVDNLVKKIAATPVDKRSDYDKDLYKQLTDPKKLAKSQEALAKRLSKDKERLNKPNSSAGQISKVPSRRPSKTPSSIDPGFTRPTTNSPFTATGFDPSAGRNNGRRAQVDSTDDGGNMFGSGNIYGDANTYKNPRAKSKQVSA